MLAIKINKNPSIERIIYLSRSISKEIIDIRIQYEGFEVQSIEATSQELEYIKNQFFNIPVTKGSYCIWQGEMANFILNNLH